MLRVDRDHAVQWLADVVDPEKLRICQLVRFCFDAPADHDVSVVDPADRVSHGQSEGTVPVFLDFAGSGICQPSDSVGLICHQLRDCLRLGVKNWDHKINHLGMILTVMPLASWIPFTPGDKTGKDPVFSSRSLFLLVSPS